MRTAIVVVACAAAAMAGCTDPYRNDPDRRAVDGERPLPPRPRVARGGIGVPTVTELVTRATRLAGNWTGSTVAENYSALARISTGDARTDALTTAARLPTDRVLTAKDSWSRVRIEAIVVRPGGALVVAREKVSTDGAPVTRYRVTVAKVRAARRGWLLSSWEPQP